MTPRALSECARAVRVGFTWARPRAGASAPLAMSRRLRAALLAFQLEQGRPEEGPIAVVDHANYRRRHFLRVCAAGRVGLATKPDGSTRLRTPKDLRDTYASQLLTVGVQLGYVSAQLGHADVSVTARHYARWAGGDAYRRPLEVRDGEVPADLLARLAEKSHQSPTTAAKGLIDETPGTFRFRGLGW